MSEDLQLISTDNKEEKYQHLLPQLKAIIEGETDLIANLSNIASVLKYGMDFFWVGFYLIKNDEMILGPFQGPPACTRIKKGKGVCGTAWEKKEILIVDDVDQFPGHIACSSKSKSEIVLPIFKNNEVIMVMDVDSDQFSAFDTTDEKYLSEICSLIQTF